MENFHYLDNSFENATKGNKQLMYDFLVDHLSKLRTFPADPEITAILTSFEPFAFQYFSDDSEVKVAMSKSHSLSLEVSSLFEELGSARINKWDIEIQMSYPKGSSVYNDLFPKGHKPLYKGDRNKRMAYFKAFRNTLMASPDMDPVKTEVDDFCNLLDGRYKALIDKQNTESLLSDKLEEQRIIVAQELYGNLGLLMKKFRQDAQQINKLFDFDLLRKESPKPEEEVFSGTVGGALTVNIIEREFTDTSRVIIENTGITDLNFCLAISAATSCHDAGIILHPEERQQLMVSELGNLNNHFLNVTNLYAADEGYYTVTVI